MASKSRVFPPQPCDGCIAPKCKLGVGCFRNSCPYWHKFQTNCCTKPSCHQRSPCEECHMLNKEAEKVSNSTTAPGPVPAHAPVPDLVLEQKDCEYCERNNNKWLSCPVCDKSIPAHESVSVRVVDHGVFCYNEKCPFLHNGLTMAELLKEREAQLPVPTYVKSGE